MYKVDTGLLPIRDPHADAFRPVVVIKLIADLRMLAVCTRTSQKEDGSGVFHPADASLQLNRNGWFRQKWLQSVRLEHFVAPLVIRLGALPPPVFDEVLEEVNR